MAARLALVIALLAAFAPATARAQSFDAQSCRSAGGTPAFCVGVEKLGERASAECRRLGVLEDAACWSRVGRRVIRAEVDAFERSALARTLRFQERLGDRLAFREAPWIGTHNSYNATAEAPTLSHTDSNQQLGVVDQLRLGVRSLELDLHWIAGAVVVCHGQGNVGCTTERRLSAHLAEIVAWLDANPRAVLLLYLEDGLDDAAGYEAAAAEVSAALGDRLYRPRAEGCANLPLDLTRAAVRRAGAQVVVVGSCGQGSWPGVSHAWPGTVRHEARPKAFSFPTCGGVSAADSAAKLVRFYEDSTFVSRAGEHAGVSSTDDGLTPETVGHMLRCGVDLLGFDQLLPSDGRLAAMAWSWADGEPARRPGCAVQRSDGRWALERCAAKRRPACLTADGAWVVGERAVTRRAAAGACRQVGARLATPRTAVRNAELRDAAGDAKVWLAYRAR